MYVCHIAIYKNNIKDTEAFQLFIILKSIH